MLAGRAGTLLSVADVAMAVVRRTSSALFTGCELVRCRPVHLVILCDVGGAKAAVFLSAPVGVPTVTSVLCHVASLLI